MERVKKKKLFPRNMGLHMYCLERRHREKPYQRRSYSGSLCWFVQDKEKERRKKKEKREGMRKKKRKRKVNNCNLPIFLGAIWRKRKEKKEEERKERRREKRKKLPANRLASFIFSAHFGSLNVCIVFLKFNEKKENYSKKVQEKNPTTRNRTRDLEISSIKNYSLPLYQLSYSRMLLGDVRQIFPVFISYISSQQEKETNLLRKHRRKER